MKLKLCQNNKCLTNQPSYYTISTATDEEKYCSQRCQDIVEGTSTNIKTKKEKKF